MTEKTFPATVEVYPKVAAWLEEKLGEINCPMKELLTIGMCLEEAYINIAHYAYGEAQGNAILGFEYAEGVVTLCLRDRGVPFNPLEREDPEIEVSLEEKSVGGLGIYLVKTMMDSVSYARVNGENVLTFSKRIS